MLGRNIVTTMANNNKSSRESKRFLVVVGKHRKQQLLLWSAAAFSTLPGGGGGTTDSMVSAFGVVTTPPSPRPSPFFGTHTTTGAKSRGYNGFGSPPSTTTTGATTTSARYFSKRSDGSSKEEGGLLDSVKDVAKAILPSSWFQSDAERQAALERKQRTDEIKGGLRELFKDAPLPIRALGGLVAPLVSSAMSAAAESLAQQQAAVDDYLAQAQRCLQADPAVVRRLGDPVRVGSPFSQSSSTTNVNGKSTSRVQIGFAVSGSKGVSAMAQLSATGEAGLQSLVVQGPGFTLNVNVNKTSSSSSSSANSKRFSSGNDDDDVIEAEIIDKDTTRR